MSKAEKLYISRPVSNIAAKSGNASSGDMAVATTADDIKEFIDKASRPIRARQARNRPDMVCLYEIGKFEHLLERLGFVFYDNQQRRRDAHVAIETCLRPLLVQQKSSDEATHLAKLHDLVEQRELVYSAKPAGEGKQAEAATGDENKSLALIKLHKVGNAILVPDGISIVGAKASEVIAEAKVVKAPGASWGLNGLNCLSKEVAQKDCVINSLDGDERSQLIKHYEAELKQAGDAKTIVLEIINDSKEHWKAAYEAAKRVRQASKAQKSVMLVPLPEVFEQNPGHRRKQRIDKQAVLQGIQQAIEPSSQGAPRTSGKRDPYACLDDVWD